jgi:hypothetical protein
MKHRLVVLALFLALCPHCTKHAPPQPPDAEPSRPEPSVDLAQVASAPSALPAPSPSAEESPDAVSCDGDVCHVRTLSERAVAQLEKEKGHKTKRIEFRDDASDEDLKNLSAIPWITRLVLSNCKTLTDLTPLAALKGLRELSLENAANVVDIAPLAGLKELTRLSLSGTSVENLAPLKDLQKLTRLDLRGVKAVDLLPLLGLTKLEALNVSGIKAKDWSPLARLKELRTLDASGSNLATAGPLATMKHLRKLNLAQCRDLKDIGALRVLRELEQLRLDDVPITSVAAVGAMFDLQVLSMSGTKLADIKPLETLGDLRSVDLQRTSVSNFDPLVSSAKSLKYLGLPKGTKPEQYAAISAANRRLRPDIAKR